MLTKDGFLSEAEAEESLSLALATGVDIRTATRAVREGTQDALFAELRARLARKAAP